MSFDAYDAGYSRDGDSEYLRLTTQVETNITSLNSQVANLQKMIKLMGTPRDGPDLQHQFSQLQEHVRKQIVATERSIKQMGQFDGGTARESGKRRLQQDQYAKRFKDVLVHFRQACETAMTMEKKTIAQDRARANSFRDERRPNQDDRSGLMKNDRMQMEQVQYNQAMIREREEGMREIEATMIEVNEIFRDLSGLVHDQGLQLNTIEAHMSAADTHVEKGTGELVKASDYQKKARNKMICLLVIVAIVAIILISVLVTQLK